MSRPVSSHPGVCERVAGHHLADFGAYEALDSIGQRPGQRVELSCDERWQPALGERIHGLIGDSVTSRRVKISAVILSATAAWIAGSRASGATVVT